MQHNKTTWCPHGVTARCLAPTWLMPFSQHVSKQVAIWLPVPQAHFLLYTIWCHIGGLLGAQRKALPPIEQL